MTRLQHLSVGEQRHIGKRITTAPSTGRAETRRAGVTLIELLAVLAIIAIATTVVGLATTGAREPNREHPSGNTSAAAEATPAAAQLAALRARALAGGTPLSVTLMMDDKPHAVTAYPDGSVVGDVSFRIDRMTGRPVPHAR